MNLTFMGSGSAFSLTNYHANVIIEANGKKFLIDCGGDARFSLKDLGYTYKDIDSIYISHIHADHVGGLEWMGFSTKFDPDCTKPTLIAHKNILTDLWEHSLLAGMRTLDTEKATLESYFETKYLDYPATFEWQGIKFELIQTFHVKGDSKFIDSYGLFFKLNNTKILFSTDTRVAFDHFLPYYEKSDIIFHDCETLDKPSGVHSNYKELVKFPEHIKNKMWLYHYNPDKLPDCKAEGFLGFVEKGQKFSF